MLTFHPLLLHLGMIVVGLPYAFRGQTGVTEVMGNSPYGALAISPRPARLVQDGGEVDVARLTDQSSNEGCQNGGTGSPELRASSISGLRSLTR